MEEKTFGFLAHRVESWNALLDSRLFDCLQKNPQNHWHWWWLAPLYWVVPIISLFTRRGYDIVDKFHFSGMKSQTVLLQNYGWHFLEWLGLWGLIRRRILRAVLAMQEENQVIGLGAMVKNEQLTRGGEWIVEKLGDKLTSWLVHGDTLTAAAVLKKIDEVIRKYHFNSPVFMTGATSKIGRAIALKLAENQIPVKMYTRSKERFAEIVDEAGEFGRFLDRATSLKEGADCQLWLTGKSSPAGKKLLRAIPKGSVVINFSVPNPLGENNHQPKPGILAIEGGLLAYGKNVTDIRFNMRNKPEETYACHGGVAVHAYRGWQFHEVGQVELPMLKETWQAAGEIGFFLPALPEMAAQVVKEPKSLWKKLADVPAAGIVL